MMRLMRGNGQTTIEYAILIAIVVGALITMQIYIKRALQGRLRSAGDQIGEQYEPGKMSGTITTTINRDILTEVETQELIIEGKEGYATIRTETIKEDKTERKGSETVGRFGSSLWE